MAGGTFVTMNRKQPGFYLNMNSVARASASVGDRGTVVISRHMSWGNPAAFTRLDSPLEAFAMLGYDYSDDSMLWVREIFLGTNRTSPPKKLLVYRLDTTGAVKAALSADALTATAKYPGVRGNDIYVVVSPDVDTEYEVSGGEPGEVAYAVYTVETVVDGTPVDIQTVGSYIDEDNYVAAVVGDVVDNDWVTFSGTATALLTPFVGAPMTGGADGTVLGTAYSNFLLALEDQSFDVVIYDGTDTISKQALTGFVKRMSYDFGLYRQAVIADYTAADDPTVISNVNSCTIEVGRDANNKPIYRTLTPQEFTWWLGGAQAGANIFQSLTYAIKPNAVEAAPVIKPSDRDASIDKGELAMIKEFDA
ncbi:MAG: phage tail sheath subtilisin-like domain-containing protein, partial [Oscillospiraceae bacterium]|nr:phage tail sheath subtilisin-like domain-containing protein [Oscillospiraceae bacterium]